MHRSSEGSTEKHVDVKVAGARGDAELRAVQFGEFRGQRRPRFVEDKLKNSSRIERSMSDARKPTKPQGSWLECLLRKNTWNIVARQIHQRVFVARVTTRLCGGPGCIDE